jgi:hypothetical protein
MNLWKSLAVAAALLLMGSVALALPSFKQSSSTKTDTSTQKPAIHHEMGVISSMDASDLVLSHIYKGKAESTTFKLDSNTKKEGTVDKGAHVVVYYKNENHERIATAVKAEPAKS